MKNLVKLKYYLKPILAAFSSLVILGVVIVPQIFAYFDVKDKISGVQSRTNNIQAKASELETVDTDLYRQNLEKVFTALPKEKEVPLAMVSLQNIITESGLILDSIKLIDTPVAVNANSYMLNLFVVGQKESLKVFLLGLLQSPRLLKLESIDAQSVKGGAGLEAEIQVSVYFDPASTITTNIDQPLPKLSAGEEELLNRIISQLSANNLPISAENIDIPSGKSDPFN